MSLSPIQTRRWTRQEYERMGESGLISPDERVALLDGDIIPMTPQHSIHSVAIGLAGAALQRIFGINHWVRIQLPLIIDPASEPEPDLAVVFSAPREYVDEHPRTALLVIEISDISLDKDRNRKLPLYAQAGIPKYWIVNLVDQCLEVYRDPVSSQNEQPAQYRTFITLGAKDNVSPSAQPEHTIAVSDLLP